MLSPSDFNNAVPQFTNGTYASNPLNPQYIAEPSSTDYNRGTEPLQTLPAQWWNWFINKFTGRFNKVNIYVKNLFNELAQLLSVVDMSPDGTEGTPTVGQLKCMFQCEYPTYLKDTTALSCTYVPQTTMVNGHALCGNVTVTCVACAGANGSGTAFGTAATVNTGTAAGCIPTVGTALGTTDGQFLATDESGNLKPSGYTASCFRASSWTPTCVACADKGKNGSSYSAFGSNAFNSTEFTTCTGTVTQVKVGTTAYNPSSGVISLPAYPTTPTCVRCACTLVVETTGCAGLTWTGSGYSISPTYVFGVHPTQSNLDKVARFSTSCLSVYYANSAGTAGTAETAGSAGSAGYATCTCRVKVYTDALCMSGTCLCNRCAFPIIAFYKQNSSCYYNGTMYLPANSKCLLNQVSISASVAFRVY